MPKIQAQLPKEGLHITPQKREKIIKMDYGRGCFDPKKDCYTFFNKNSSSTKKGSEVSSRISSGRKVNHCGTPGGNGHR